MESTETVHQYEHRVAQFRFSRRDVLFAVRTQAACAHEHLVERLRRAAIVAPRSRGLREERRSDEQGCEHHRQPDRNTQPPLPRNHESTKHE
jgi:hypothetical protein